jgi:hypothetical protein
VLSLNRTQDIRTPDEYKADPLGMPPPPLFSCSMPSPPAYIHRDMREHRESPEAVLQDNGLNDSGQTIQKLLGRDVEAYMNAHVGVYEDAKKRWTECSIEEWEKGADGNVFFLNHGLFFATARIRCLR